MSSSTRRDIEAEGGARASGPQGPVPVVGRRRLLELDGLRGVAVLLVVLSHTAERTVPYGGVIGVTVFFVLSGYLITGRLVAEHESTGRISLRDFWIRRAARLAPAFVLLLAAVPAVAWLLGDPAAERYLRTAPFLALQAGDYLRAVGVPLGAYEHTWSLAVEEQFYVLWPILVAVVLSVRGRALPWVALGSTAVFLAWRVTAAATLPYDWVAYSFDTSAYALLLGCSTALWQARRHRALPASVAVAGVGVLCLASVCTVPWLDGPSWDLARWLEPAAAIVAVLVVTASESGVRLLRWRVLRWFGQISYGLYLWHYLVLSVRPGGVESSGVLRVVLLVASIGVAAVSWHLVEQPVLRRVHARLHRRA